MSLGATAANLAWAAANLPSWIRYRRALEDPARVQRARLAALVAAGRGTAFGRAHDFDGIAGYQDFARRVPLGDAGTHAPWIDRIRRGEAGVLTRDPVRRLVPTSGSTGARKLIPFTATLQREFNAAIGPWMADLVVAEPALMAGPAYWSITPLADSGAAAEESAVPIGFDDDAACLGDARRRLVGALMAVPASVRTATGLAAFRCTTLAHLLRRGDLRLVSVWHPSFFALLLEALATDWSAIVAQAVRLGMSPRRRREVEAVDPARPHTIWPRLRLISCWSDAHARGAADALARCFPGVAVQPKGLLATEAFVSLPFAGRHPLAVCSHVLEFLRDDGRVVLAHELREGEACEVIVTTGGGLWRYRLGDRVVVDGFVGRTPSVRFLGRAGQVSDRRGEKLSEAFVASVLRAVFAAPPVFVLLAPEEDVDGVRYVLFIEAETVADDTARRLDEGLRANPHYAWCRDLGQLGPPRVACVARGAFAVFAAHGIARGRRLGDIKPTPLSDEAGWSARFAQAARRRGESLESIAGLPQRAPFF